MISGSCLCGKTRYECEAPAERAYNCYCSRCRKARGTAFAANLFAPLAPFRWTAGESLIRTFYLPDAEHFVNAFCSACGSSMPVTMPSRGLVGIPMGSLDVEPGIEPQSNIFVGSKCAWAEISDSRPRFEAHVGSTRLNRS